jgi:nucleoside-diphosphate-sugar epimerase
MDVTVAGAHGKIARLLIPLLVARGDRVRGVIRNPDQAPDVRADGAEPVVCDLETATDDEVDAVVAGTDAVVFAAGAGPGSGAARKWTVDHGAARKLIDAATRLGIRRYVMVSAMGAADPPQDDEVFSVYLRAKALADEDLRTAGLDHTIVRPGGLIDDPAQGLVTVGAHVDRGRITRGDVAALIAAVLPEPSTYGRTFELVRGDTPVDEAIARIGRMPPDAPA